MSWVDLETSTVGADRPLHAGALLGWLGNLQTTLDESGWRYQSISHGSTAYASHLMSTSTVWEDMTPEWGSWPGPLRQVEGGGLRQLRVVVEAAVNNSCTATLRLYALPGQRSYLELDADDGLIGAESYGDITVTLSTMTALSTTITVAEATWAGAEVPGDEHAPATRYEEIALHAAVTFSSSGSGQYLRLMPPYIEEVP